MKRFLSLLTCALTLLFSSQPLSDAQTKNGPLPRQTDKKARIVAVNTNELEAFPIDSGLLKFIALSDDSNGAFALIERTQQACYKTTWHRHDNLEESFYVLEGIWTVQIADKIHEFPAGSYVLIPRGTPHGQGNFTAKPVRLLVLMTPGGFDRFYKERAELFKQKGANRAELEKGLEALRAKYVQVIDYDWKITKECRK